GIEICERLSTMGIAVNLVTYLGGVMHLPSFTSANIVTDFMGTCFLLCLLGGFLADSFLGRYTTIAIFTAVQILGTAALSLTTKLPHLRPPPCAAGAADCRQATGFQMGMLYLALYLIALGTGGLKSSVSGFGSDQFDEHDAREKSQMAYFFNRFFFFISIGTLTAVTVLVYVEDHIGRSVAYGICSVSMFIALAVFLSGTRKYRYKRSTGSPLLQIFQVIVAATRKRKAELPFQAEMLHEYHASTIHHTDQFPFLDRAAIVGDGDLEERNPWKISTVTKVEEVKMMVRLLPIWATTILFWTTYAQLITFSVEQATTMDRNIGPHFQIPAGSLTVFFVLAILITLAFNDRIIMPLWTRIKGQQGFSSLQRMGIGLVLSTIGMVAAALVETKRLKASSSSRNLSVFLLIPQFFLLGSGEAFIYTGQLDFFITQSPKGMKTMSTALFLTTLALGFFLSSFLVTVVKQITASSSRGGWLAGNIDRGRLDCFYGLLAALGGLNFAVYLVCAAKYKYQKPKHEQVVELE
ncbi:hypothetical protein M569_15702, partial [Genlisea aurea]